MAKKTKTTKSKSTKPTNASTVDDRGKVHGYRSGLEHAVSQQLELNKVKAEYEKEVIEYEVPSRKAKYHPDFKLPNGIFIETKGRFIAKDRQKHLLIQKQRPEIDLRFVFTNSKGKLYKGSKTTYADWCRKNGFKFADKFVPIEWIKERSR